MSLEKMDEAFRQSDTTLHLVLGLLSWCDDLAHAVESIEPAPPASDLWEAPPLTGARANEHALLFTLGLLSFERTLRAALSRKQAPSAAPVEPLPGPSLELWR